MYAIIETGGKQYKVNQGDVLEVEKLELKGKTATIDKVLFISDKKKIFGSPYIKGAKVEFEVLEAVSKGEKVKVFKMKRRKSYRRKQGHRQKYTKIKINSILSA